MMDGLTIMLGCSSTCYTPIQRQTTTIAAPACCYYPTWWPIIAWKWAEKSRFFLIWVLTTCDWKSWALLYSLFVL